MNTKSITQLSTAHLHPLEVELMNQVSLLHNDYGNLISIDDDILNECKRLNLVCLLEVLTELKEKYGSDYVVFDADEPAISEFKKYDW
jgi:hypothetical protein